MPSADAWRAVRAFRNVDRPRRRFLSVDEAKRLLNAAAPDFSRLARGALYTGLRLGELLALRVADIAEGQVHVRHSKAGPSRTVPLSTEGAEFFEQVTAGKAGDALLFVRESGAEWARIQVSRSMRRVCGAAKIAPPAVVPRLAPLLWVAALECRGRRRGNPRAPRPCRPTYDAPSVCAPTQRNGRQDCEEEAPELRSRTEQRAEAASVTIRTFNERQTRSVERIGFRVG